MSEDKKMQDVLSEVRGIAEDVRDLEVRFYKLSMRVTVLEKSLSDEVNIIQDWQKYPKSYEVTYDWER